MGMQKSCKPTVSIIARCGGMPTFRWLCASIVLVLALAGIQLAGMAQERPSNITPRTSRHRNERRDAFAPSLRMDVSRVLIPVTVTDTYGHKVEGLRKEDFRVFENGVQQDVSEFFVDESPASVGIVLDASNSMSNKIDHARNALSSFLRMSLPREEFILISVQDRPELVHAFTTEVEEIEHEMEAVRTRGWTALYDGIYLGINHAKRASRDNRVLLVLSDGGDNNSRYTESEIRNVVRESDVRIFSVSALGRSPSMERLAEESGGRAFHIHNLNELSSLSVSMSALIHGEYVVGFSPAIGSRDGKYHTIKVALTQPEGLHASWRHGYYGPSQ